MKRTTLAISCGIATLALLTPAPTVAQDYTQVEVWQISRLPGHSADIGRAMVDHNAEFHTEAPNGSVVFYFLTGPNADKYHYIVGPRTFSDMDQPPVSREHGADWQNSVMRDAQLEGREFWRQVDELVYVPENLADQPRPISVVRSFEIADRAAFFDGQRQVVENIAAMRNPYPRSVWCRVGLSTDPNGCVAITSFPNWAALDENVGNFEETFRRTKGDAAWEEFQATQQRAVTARQDSYRVTLGSN